MGKFKKPYCTNKSYFGAGAGAGAGAGGEGGMSAWCPAGV